MVGTLDGEMYPVLGTVDRDSIFCRKSEEDMGKWLQRNLQGVKDVPNRENSLGKGVAVCTSCHVQGLARGLGRARVHGRVQPGTRSGDERGG